jgi:hypothetical protein
MKNLIRILIFVIALFLVPNANANDLQNHYNKVGIDKVVIEFLKYGLSVDKIVPECLALEGLNPQNLIRALYCAGAKGQDIRDAAGKYGISEIILVAGYKKSVDECRDVVNDSQAYTPVSSGLTFSSPTSGRAGSFASPSTF